jgi:hypothetical protein
MLPDRDASSGRGAVEAELLQLAEQLLLLALDLGAQAGRRVAEVGRRV